MKITFRERKHPVGEDLSNGGFSLRMLLGVFGMTWHRDFVVAPEEHPVPGHIVTLIKEHDRLRVSEKCINNRNKEWTNDNNQLWKLNTVLKTCIVAERLDVEGRGLDSPPLSIDELLNLPSPLTCLLGLRITCEFDVGGRNYYVVTEINDTVGFGKTKLDIGLAIDYSYSGEQVRKDLKKCIIQMKAVQLKREEDGRDLIDVYGVVTNGEVIQFHKLTAEKKVHSSPIFLLTAEGLPRVWAYLRHIVHEIQLLAPPPPQTPSFRRKVSRKRSWEWDRDIMMNKKGCYPAGIADQTEKDGDAWLMVDSDTYDTVTRQEEFHRESNGIFDLYSSGSQDSNDNDSSESDDACESDSGDECY